MKYYYNDKLIRTSDHVYTHAVIGADGGCIACRNGYDNALKARNAMKNNTVIKEYNDAINALKSGKKYYTYKVCRITHTHYFKPEDTIEKYQEWLERAKVWNEAVDNLQIVELVAR